MRGEKKLTEEDVYELRSLYEMARRYRGSNAWADEAKQFAEMVWMYHDAFGVSYSEMAECLGVTWHALSSRMARYGLRDSEGSSPTVDPLKGRGERKSRTHCLRGHEFVEGSYYVMKDGSRLCKKCDKMRTDKHRQKKKQGGS